MGVGPGPGRRLQGRGKGPLKPGALGEIDKGGWEGYTVTGAACQERPPLPNGSEEKRMAKRSHSESVFINTGSGFALKLVVLMMNLVLKRIFIHTLGVQYNGVSTLFTDILSMLSLAEMGVGSAITFALYRPIREQDNRRIAALMNFYRKAYHLIACMVMAGGALCIPFLPYLVKEVPDIQESITLIFVLYVVNNATSYLRIYKSTLLTASERGYMINRVTIWFVLGRTVLECVLLLVFKNFILYLVVGILESLVRNAVISREAEKLYPQINDYADERLTKEETRRLLGDVGALALYKICQVILSSTDSIVISAAPALGVVTVGFLGNYRLLFNTINQLVSQFYQAFTPSLGVLATEADAEKQHQVFRTVNFMAFWVMCFCCTSLVCLSSPFVRLWLGKDYILPLNLLLVMALNNYISSMNRATNIFRNGNGLFVQGKFRPVGMAVMNIAMDIVLVKPLGVFGVLLATCIARLTTQVWYDPWLVHKKVFKRSVKPYFWRMGIYTLLTASACALTYWLCGLIGQAVSNLYLAFLLRMVLCVLIPNGIVVLLYHRTPEFKDLIHRVGGITKRIGRALGRRGPSA